MSASVGIFQTLASTDPEENYLAASPTPSIASRYTSSISSALLSPSCTLVDEYEVDWYTMLPTCKSDKGAVLVTLVITLVHLWGPQPPESRYRRMLANFLRLVEVIRTLDDRHLTKSLLDQCEGHLRVYVKELFQLYHDASFKPNHHLSLHIPSFLQFSGPAHASAAWSFEQFIGGAQKIQTNYQSGQSVALVATQCLFDIDIYMLRGD